MILNLFSKNVIFPLFQIKHNNYPILKAVKRVEKDYSQSKEKVDEMRLTKLKKIFEHAYIQCSFYRDLFNKYSVDVGNVGFDTLKNLPILSKSQINQNRNQIIASNLRSYVKKDSTGGSTTEPLIFYRDKSCWIIRNAYQLYFNKILGLNIGTKSALIWGAGKDLYSKVRLKERVKDGLVFRRIHLNATSMDSFSVNAFLKKFIQFKPEIIYGYPTAINALCNEMIANNIFVDFVKAVICTAEPLNSEHRNKITSFFNCEVYDRYTSRETGIIAQECKDHNGMHINSLSVYLEIRNNKIILTDLDNYGMPLINYEIGDMTREKELNYAVCECGFPTELMQLGASRESDFFIKRDGTLIFGAGIPIIELTGESGVKNIQIIQKDYEVFLVRIVKDRGFNENNLKGIQATLTKYLGNNIEINYEYVGKIDRSKTSGKYKFIVSEIKR